MNLGTCRGRRGGGGDCLLKRDFRVLTGHRTAWQETQLKSVMGKAHQDFVNTFSTLLKSRPQVRTPDVGLGGCPLQHGQTGYIFL